MNKLLIASVALAAASVGGPALAADMPLKAPPPVVVYNWTGCYLGLYIGDDTGRYNTTTAGATAIVGTQTAATVASTTNIGGLPVTNNTKMSGFLGGGTVGCNYQ